ncbi:MAG TPA: 2-isopropylmalate synthase [Desulfotomaculum sp.]|nr:MAG: 2-isopropylmalate synthase [Desulfotomaculum sp. 46_80]HAG11980.1 2-isopropylmalate synthase [Desulfotomaculum sp.]HBY04762.1 2-isopropylmalate synthase [Desulfotomaculum sp.]
MRKLYVFDTTLRDGEQSLGITLNIREKLEIGRQLVHLGVDVIEAGFPASSPGDFKAVEQLAREIKGVTICGLTRAVIKDIDLCWEALKDAQQPRIHTGLALSPIHRQFKLGVTLEQGIEMAVGAVKHAKKFVQDVEYYSEDAFRTEPEILARVVSGVIKAGATVINIPDTVGYAMPWEYGELITWLMNNVEGMDKVIVSVHCHNDLGMATANALAGIKAGASQVEGTINGIGERAGNTALEEVIMSIYTQPSRFGINTTVNYKEIARTSRLVSKITGVQVPAHKAIVGENAFMHASGIHQDGVLKERSTYEIIDPSVIGISQNKIVLTARSGRHALRHCLEELGYQLEESALNKAYENFLILADQKQEIFDEDLHALMGNKEGTNGGENIILKSFSVSTAGPSRAMATVELDLSGNVITDAACGNGPVDAVFNAIDRLVGCEVTLEDYSLKSITKGKDAMGDATVKIKTNDSRLYVGHGLSTDVIEASAKAYVNALAKAVAQPVSSS